MMQRRHLLGAIALAPLAAPSIARAQAARTVKMGSLRLIHSMTPHFYQRFAPAGLTIEITTFDSPTDSKNAVVTRSVDFAGFGIAAGTLGAAAGEPVVVVGAFCNRGMGVIAKAGSGISNIAGLRGKRIGIWPGSTQEVFILERLRQSGMTVRDVTSVRVPFGEMHAMLSRGDIDAYVGAEPGLNMIFATSEAMIAQDPALVRTMLGIHRRASEYMMANKAEVAEATVRILGAQRAAVDRALAENNVEYIWKLDDTVITQARAYAQQMLEMRQIRALPNFDKFLNARFSNEVATS
jgi:NitT/TauT family transport system substrate-binding protein